MAPNVTVTIVPRDRETLILAMDGPNEVLPRSSKFPKVDRATVGLCHAFETWRFRPVSIR